MFSFLDFLFPKHSLEGREGAWITPSEFARLVSYPRIFQREELKKLGMRSLDRVFAATTYRDVPLLRKAIALFKYRRIPGLGETLQGLLADAFLKHCTPRRDACICPVPLHFLRKFWRGFNQAEILAEAMAVRTGLPMVSLVWRIRPTGQQAGRKRGERWRAVRGAFAVQKGFGLGFGRRNGLVGNVVTLSGAAPCASSSCFDNPSTPLRVTLLSTSLSMTRRGGDEAPNPSPNPPFAVYLVDDLMTTGATLEECAKVLKAAGVKRVEGVVLAHG